MKTKQKLSLLLAVVMILALTACGSSTPAPAQQDAAVNSPAPAESTSAPAESTPAPEETPAPVAEDVEIIVFAAASMTETMTQIAELYKAVAPNVTITYNFDSSGTLLKQIQEGADCDLFISAAPKQMNTLEEEGYLLDGTRFNLLENKVALAVPEGNAKGIESYDDLIAGLKDGSILLAMGNSDVPVGQYTQKILQYFNLNEEELAKSGVITYGSNVKEVTSQVTAGSVDAGIIYGTDAFSAKLEVVDTATAEMCGQVIYPAAQLKEAPNADAAALFLDYLTSADATAVFESVGFTALN